MSWNNYKYEEPKRVEPGDYRVEIIKAEETVSKSGNKMIVVTLRPNGTKLLVRDYIVDGDYFDQKASRLFDAFPEIGDGNFNLVTWGGAVGAARLREDGDFLKVHYYITPEKAEVLPEWMGNRPQRMTVTDLEEITDESDLPF